MAGPDANFAVGVELSHILENFHDKNAKMFWIEALPGPQLLHSPFRKHNRQNSHRLRAVVLKLWVVTA